MARLTPEIPFEIALSLDAVNGWDANRKFGINPVVASTTVYGDVWPGPTASIPRNGTPSTLYLTTADAQDTALGTGAQAVTVSGVDDATGEFASEVLATAGVGDSAATTIVFRDASRCWVSAIGAHANENNIAAISVKRSSDAAVMAYIRAGLGQTQQCNVLTPEDWASTKVQLTVSVASAQNASFRVWQQKRGGVKRISHEIVSLDGGIPSNAPFVINGNLEGDSYMWVEAIRAGGAAAVTADLSIVLGAGY